MIYLGMMDEIRNWEENKKDAFDLTIGWVLLILYQ